jgi:hypothetical protein
MASYAAPYYDDGSTVNPNPSISNMSNASSANDLMQMGSTMAQWGSTIAGMVTGNAPVSTAAGTVVYIPPTPAKMSSTTMLLLLAAGVVVVLLVMNKL